MKKNQATYNGTSGWIINDGVKGLNIFNKGLVNLTKTLIKKIENLLVEKYSLQLFQSKSTWLPQEYSQLYILKDES